MHSRGTLASGRFLTHSRLLLLWLFVFGAIEARSCWASCGDYLLAHHVEVVQDVARGAGPLHSEPKRHCTGPHCQRDDRTPIAPSKAFEFPSSVDMILTVVTTVVHSSNLTRILIVQVHTVAAVTHRVFRPPRAF